ncbi:MAG: hypothetical protein QN179_08700, partial [Armatimonadota bacterium]|nr:hypothetical protein [Armatimonadota bacterium]
MTSSPARSPAAADPTLLRAWLGVAAGAAGTSGLLAVLVALARMPGARFLSPHTFSTLLVGHVAFALIVWLLGGVVVTALAACGGRGAGGGGRVGAILAAGGSLLVLLASLSGRGRPVLSDYVP